MKNWQQIIKDHHATAEVVNDNTMRINNIGYRDNTTYTDVITRANKSYIINTIDNSCNMIVDTVKEDDLYLYLGY